VSGGRLTTHVLDTANGRPAARVGIELARLDGDRREVLRTLATNDDGRTDEPLLDGGDLAAAEYELTFDVGAYFQSEGFLDRVPVRFTVADPDAHYHVPLLVSPWSYSTYRGS
jgi:5-hydroxyisourate hydrolase